VGRSTTGEFAFDGIHPFSRAFYRYCRAFGGLGHAPMVAELRLFIDPRRFPAGFCGVFTTTQSIPIDRLLWSNQLLNQLLIIILNGLFPLSAKL
jgi:hypothetical protein